MSARRKEIYARAAVQLRTHDRCRAAEKACPGAMGLYLFLLLQARGEETDGEVSEDAALESWTAPTTYRRKQLAALVSAGLVERSGRLVITKYAEHNDVPAIIAANKERDRERKWRERHPESGGCPPAVPTDIDRTGPPRHAPVPSSISCSGSGSDSDLPSGDPDLPDRSGGPPMWFREAAKTAEQAVGAEVGELPARWLEYSEARRRKGWGMNAGDAASWLTAVVRRERRDGPRRARADTRQPLGDPDAPWLKRFASGENDL